MNKPIKKFEKLKHALSELDSLKTVIIKVIEQGGDIEMEWLNTGIVNSPSCLGEFREVGSNGSQVFTFRIPPHNQ
jgi:hypothetical protein